MLYRLKHYFRKLKRNNPPSISSGKISLFSCQEGFKIFFGLTELTKNTGLGISWKEGGEVRDSSSYKTQILLWDPAKLKVLKYSGNGNGSPVFEFSFNVLSPLLIQCLVFLDSKVPISSLKICLMMNQDYKNWISGAHEGAMPAFKQWHRVGTPEGLSPFIGLRSADPSSPLMPAILSFEGATHFVENSDAACQARILCAEYEGEFQNGELKGNLFLFQKKENYLSWITQQRQEKLL